MASLLQLWLRSLLVTLLVISLSQEARSIKCVQCEADRIPGAPDDPCISDPPPPKPCESSMSVCMSIRTYIPAEQDSRQLVSVVRTCGPSDMGWDCEMGRTQHGRAAEVCHDTCDYDGCNGTGANSPSWFLLVPLFALLALRV